MNDPNRAEAGLVERLRKRVKDKNSGYLTPADERLMFEAADAIEKARIALYQWRTGQHSARSEKTENWHKPCGDCVTIRGLKFCTMNCSGIPNNEKASITG